MVPEVGLVGRFHQGERARQCLHELVHVRACALELVRMLEAVEARMHEGVHACMRERLRARVPSQHGLTNRFTGTPLSKHAESEVRAAESAADPQPTPQDLRPPTSSCVPMCPYGRGPCPHDAGSACASI
eukprot:6177483-Pleurochrysis_carterae.AAC.1